MSDAHHLCVGPEVVAGNGTAGRVFLLPGSAARAHAIAAHFDDVVAYENPRRHDVLVGTLTRGGVTVDVGTVNTGMGCPSLGIIVSELIGLGARQFLRVGTAGTLQPELIGVGDLIIATGAVRDEGASDAFAPRTVPAVAHPDWVSALADASRALGFSERTFRGLVHSKDALYGREFPAGPMASQNAEYMAVLERLGVMASEMESSHLFILAQTHGPDLQPITGSDNAVVKAGAILAIIGSSEFWAEDDDAAAAIQRAIDVALQAAVNLGA